MSQSGFRSTPTMLVGLALLLVTLPVCLCSEGGAGKEKLNPNRTVTDEVWFDVLVRDIDGEGDDYTGRFTVALFGMVAPMTSLNFASIAKGYSHGKKKLHYKNTYVHRVVPDFVIQMGDVTIGDGTGGASIFGSQFNDENFILSHRSAGWVAMANTGPDSNSSQFYIVLNKSRWLDGHHVVFGKVIRGMDVIRTLAEIPADRKTAKPEKKIKIVDCGVNELVNKYELPEAILDSDDE